MKVLTEQELQTFLIAKPMVRCGNGGYAIRQELVLKLFAKKWLINTVQHEM
jgi:hypothetical protein